MSNYYPINDDLAREAHYANSFFEFRSDEPDYRAEVDSVYFLAEEAAERDPERAEEALALADKFASRYADWLNEGYRIDAMCPSVMIAGPANFPIRKKEKQNRARENHYEALKKIEYIKEKIKKIGDIDAPIKSNDPKVIEKLTEKLDALEKRHLIMKNENAKARKNGTPVPYAPYTLSNSRQNIASVKKRLETLESQKDRGTEKRTAVILGEEVEIVENTEIMRLQLIFDGKPSDNVREALKRHGFRWSPKNVAWQRQLTDNARYALSSLENEQ